MITTRTSAKSYDLKAVLRDHNDDRQPGRPKVAQHLTHGERRITYILPHRKLLSMLADTVLAPTEEGHINHSTKSTAMMGFEPYLIDISPLTHPSRYAAASSGLPKYGCAFHKDGHSYREQGHKMRLVSRSWYQATLAMHCRGSYLERLCL